MDHRRRADATGARSGSSRRPPTPSSTRTPSPATRPRRQPRRARHLEMWRKAGAAARQMLKQAAAQEWSVLRSKVDTSRAVVIHRPEWRRLMYGQLVDQSIAIAGAARIRFEDEGPVPLHRQGSIAASTSPFKTDGRAIVRHGRGRVPGMLMASIDALPGLRRQAQSFERHGSKAVPGVRHVGAASADRRRRHCHQLLVGAPGSPRAQVTWGRGRDGGRSRARRSVKQYAALRPAGGQVARNEATRAGLGGGARSSRPSTSAVPGARVHGPMTPPPTSCPNSVTLWAPTRTRAAIGRSPRRSPACRWGARGGVETLSAGGCALPSAGSSRILPRGRATSCA